MHSSNGFCAAGRYKFSTSVRVCFCSVNFRPLRFYCVNKLVRSYLLHIFIWPYIFPLSTKVWTEAAEAQRRGELFNTPRHLTLFWCFGPIREHHKLHVILGKLVLCRGGQRLPPRNALPLSRAHCDGSYWLEKVFSVWRPNQCPKGKKVFGSSTRKKCNTSLGNFK